MLDVRLMQPLTEILPKVNLFAQTFRTPTERDLGYQTPTY